MAKMKDESMGVFENYESDKLTKPRDDAWNNFVKWTEEGQKVQGYIRDVFFRKEETNDDGTPGFKPQRGIVLEQTDGTLCIVTVKRLPFILDKTDNLRLGDPLTVVYEKTLPPAKKGWSGVKQFAFYGKNLEENKANKTVKQLDAEDMATYKAPELDFGPDGEPVEDNIEKF